MRCLVDDGTYEAVLQFYDQNVVDVMNLNESVLKVIVIVIFFFKKF